MAYLPSAIEQEVATAPATTGYLPSAGYLAPSLSYDNTFDIGTPGEGLEQSILRYPESTLGQYMAAQERQVWLKAGLDPDDPAFAGMSSPLDTLEAQQEANNTAIAKIASVNPDLAKQLLAKREGQPEESGGLWDDIKGAVGDIVAPALAIGGKALELLSRPAQIIPELITDKEGDAWYEDIGQALTGHSKAYGDDVVRKLFGEDTAGWIQGLAGFVTDVVADPLTYMTFGAAGVGRAAAGSALTGAVAKTTLAEVAEGAVTGIAKESAEAVARQVAEEGVDSLAQRLTTHVLTSSDLHVDAAQSIVAKELAGVPQDVVQHFVDNINPMLRSMNRTGLHKMTPEMWNKWRPLLEKERSALQMVGTRASRGEARALAGAMGGTRFVAGVPFTQFRFTSAALPFTHGLGFRPATNFFRGVSGLNRLGKAVDNMAVFEGAGGLRERVFATYFREGWEGVANEYPELMKELGNGPLHPGSMFRSMSERMGRVTKGLSNHSQWFRNGDLGALFTYQAATHARTASERWLDEFGWTLYDDQGKAVQGGRDIEKEARTVLDLRDADKRKLYSRHNETVPLGVSLDNLDEWEAEQSAMLENLLVNNPEHASYVERQIERISKQKDAIKTALTDPNISVEERTILDKLRRMKHTAMVELDKRGGAIHDRSIRLEMADELATPDIERFVSTGRRELAEKEWFVATGEAGKLRMADQNYDSIARGVPITSVKTPTTFVEDAAGPGRINAAELVSKARENGGFTVNTTTGRDMAGGWAVAEPKFRGYERRVGLDGSNLQQDVDTFYAEHADLLERGDHFIGGWIDNNELVLDVTRIIKNQDEAMHYAAIGGQDAIFNLDTYDTINAGIDTYPQMQRAALRSQKPFIIDERPNAKTNNQAYLDEVSAEVEQDLDRMAPGEETLDIPYDEWLARKKKEGIAARLRAEGYDSIIVKHTDDDWDGVVFGPNLEKDPNLKERGHWNLKLWNDNAPRVREHEGFHPRIVTERFRKHIGLPTEEKPMFVAELKHEKGRNLDEMPLEEAERYLQQKYGFNGQVFYDDPLEVHARYVQRLAADYEGSILEGAGKRLSSGLYTDRWGVGMAVDANRYEWRLGALHDKNIRVLETKHRNLMFRKQKLIQKQVETMEKQAGKMARAYDELIEDLGYSPRSARHLAAKSRKARGAIAADAGDLGRQVLQARQRVIALTKRLENTKPHNLQGLQNELTTAQDKVDQLLAELRAAKAGVRSSDRAASAADRFAATAAARTERVAKLAVNQDRTARRLERDLQGLGSEIDKIRTRFTTGQADLIPAIVAAGDSAVPAGFKRMSEVPGLSNVYVHPFIHAEFTNALGNKTPGELRQFWRHFIQGPWKRWSTVYYPGFHARNFLGAWFNNWLGGVTPAHYFEYQRLASALQGGKWAGTEFGVDKLRKYGLIDYFDNPAKVTYEQVGDLLNSQGVRAHSNVVWEAFNDEEERFYRATKGNKKRFSEGAVGSKVAWGPKRYGRLMRSTTEVTENLFRGAAWLKGLEDTQSLVGARAFAMMRHGDYEDLTDFENFVKDLVPFYKWMRTNIPYQIHQLTQAPGKTLAAIKAQRAAFVAQGIDPEENKQAQALPPWSKQAWAIPIPGGTKGDKALRFLSLDLPLSDLYTGANDYINAFLPMIRPFVESYVFKSRMGPEGSIIPLKDYTPLSSWARLPVIKQALSLFITENADGEQVISGQVQNIMGAIPIFSRFKNWIYADESSQQRRSSAFWSALAGFRYEDIGDEALTKAEKAFYYEELEPLITGLRDLGVTLPGKEDLSPAVYEYLGLNAPEQESAAPALPGYVPGGTQ